MTEHQLTLLVPPAARSAHAELLAALGTEANPAQWMTFMDAVTRLLPDVLSSGRPTKEAIQRCAIGQLGFASWQAMIEAPVDANGLGWNFSAWKAWRRAWGTVEAHPWLRQEPLTSSEVNTLAQECNRNGAPFPGSAEELEALRKGRKDAAEQRRTESVAALTAKIEGLEAELRAARASAQEAAARAATLGEQLGQATAKVAEQAELVGGLRGQLNTATETISRLVVDRDTWKGKANKPAEPVRLSRLEHLRAFFLGE